MCAETESSGNAMKKLKLSGLIAAPFTPFDADGEVNYAMIERQAAALIADGVNGAYVCGTTGEGISCSIDERVRIMETWPTERVLFGTDYPWNRQRRLVEWVKAHRPAADYEAIFHKNAERILGTTTT